MELLRIYPGIYFEYFAVFYWLWHDRGGMEQTAHSFICDSTLRSHQTHLRLLLFLRRHTRAFGTNIKWLDVVGGWKEAEIERKEVDRKMNEFLNTYTPQPLCRALSHDHHRRVYYLFLHIASN